MRHALKLGVNWIDTAAVCGLGHSEEVVGRLVRDLPRMTGAGVRLISMIRT
jgi:aryl-alcohol dehydrogenase-like predicted oxidoreductase